MLPSLMKVVAFIIAVQFVSREPRTECRIRSTFYPGAPYAINLNCYYCNLFVLGPQSQSVESWKPEVLNGRPARPGEFPYVVHLNMDSETGHGWCTGAIYDDRHIITAAHCFFSHEDGSYGRLTRPDWITVTAGTLDAHNSDGTGQIVKASALCVHEGYAKDEYRMDVAIVRLESRLLFGDKVRPASLLLIPTRTYDRKGTVVGWGGILNDYGNETLYFKPTLQTAQVNVYDASVEDCGLTEENVDYLMCAGTTVPDIPPPPGKPTGAAQGDSGGPLGCSLKGVKYDLCGALSRGNNEATINTQGQTTTFSKIASKKEWIQRYVQGKRLDGCAVSLYS